MFPVDQHLVRAGRHRKVGDALAAAGDEWALVCYFYSAFHLVRHALRTDPLFDDPVRLAGLKLPVRPEDRDTERHHGRGRIGEERDWGINELVSFLYKPHTVDYELLHQASIEVRYKQGLALPPLPAASDALKRIEDGHAIGGLRAAN